jgi:hypothetical protein
MTFSASAVGTRTVIRYANDWAGLNTGWVLDGSWTVESGNQPPTFVSSSLSGSSAVGAQQIFSFTYSDPNGATDIDSITAAFFTPTFAGCRVGFEFGYFWLANDNGTALFGPLAPNSGSLSNGYCTLTNPSVTSSGNQRTVNLPLTFTSMAVGTLQHYKYVSDWAGLSSGYVWDGSWTVVSNALTQTVTTNPAGLALTVDGAQCTAPCTFNWAANSYHTIATTSPQAGTSGTQYVFSNWSDGGGISHTAQAPTWSSTWTANFAPQYYLTTSVGSGGGGTISPASGWRAAGAVVSVSATANSGYHFSGFSGGLSGSSTPQNLTMNGSASVVASFAVSSAPTITGISTPSGSPGTLVTITGTNFGATQGTSTVTFNGVAATASSWSATQIVTMVPAAATTGNLIVTVNGLVSAAVSFVVAAAPLLTELSLTQGPPQAGFVIRGFGFGGDGTVALVRQSASDRLLTVISWSPNSITVQVPNGTAEGTWEVRVANFEGVWSNLVPFTVVPPFGCAF